MVDNYLLSHQSPVDIISTRASIAAVVAKCRAEYAQIQLTNGQNQPDPIMRRKNENFRHIISLRTFAKRLKYPRSDRHFPDELRTPDELGAY